MTLDPATDDLLAHELLSPELQDPERHDPGLQTHKPQDESGEVVLLLNGGMMTFRSWAPITNRLLENGYRVLGCDFRGQLQSPGDGHRRLIDHVPDVVALLDALNLDRVHVLATSFGAEVGLLLAALHPERVRSLVAATAVDRTPEAMAEDSRRLRELTEAVLEGEDPGPFHDALMRDIYSPDYQRRHVEQLENRRQQTAALPKSWYRGLIGILTSVMDFDLSPWLPRITCPTLIVHAELDRVMPETRVKALAAAIPGALLQVHPSSGHALVVEDPLWLGQTHLDFLAHLAERQIEQNEETEGGN